MASTSTVFPAAARARLLPLPVFVLIILAFLGALLVVLPTAMAQSSLEIQNPGGQSQHDTGGETARDRDAQASPSIDPGQRSLVLSGRIVTPTGHPIPDLQITLYRRLHSRDRTGPVLLDEQQTDGYGRFRFEVDGPGGLFLVSLDGDTSASKMKTVLRWPTDIVFEDGVSPTLPLADQPQDLVRHIVWDHHEPLVPHFVPAPVLREKGIGGLPLAPRVVDWLEEYMQYKRSNRAKDSPLRCNWTSENGFARESRPAGRSMVDVLLPQSLVARGRVRAVVPGWSHIDRGMTMIYVEIDEILHCQEEYNVRDIAPGDIVATTLQVGGFELDGVTLCSRTPVGFHLPDVGDEVVVGGSPRPGDPYFIGRSGVVFVVEDGEVLPQPYENFRWVRVSLAELRAGLNGPHVVCEEQP